MHLRPEPGFVWQLVGYALVTINAGSFLSRKARMDFGGTARLFGKSPLQSMRDIDRFPPHTATTLIYSLWPGYLDRDNGRLASWCRQNSIALEIAHTSGHADKTSLVRLAQTLRPRLVVPIHTEAPQVMQALVRNVHILRDGNWLEA